MPTSKQIKNRDKFTKDYKIKEIQRSLTKRARLKKEYLKTLKNEGYEIPNKKPASVSKGEKKQLKDLNVIRDKGKRDEKKEIRKQRKRLQLERVEETRKNAEKRIRTIKEKERERDERKVRLTQKTKSGQPRMGPKIEDMLSKIKNNPLYTEYQ